MIRLSKIDDKLTIFKDKTIVLFGAAKAGHDVKTILEAHGFHISYFCCNTSKKWGTQYEGVPVISPVQLREIYDEKVIIQISSTADLEIQAQLKKMNMLSYISFAEFMVRLESLALYKMSQRPECRQAFADYMSQVELQKQYQKEKNLQKHIILVKQWNLKSINIMCSQPKTGDFTITYSLLTHPSRGLNIWHTAEYLKEPVKNLIGDTKIKIITGVREAISQDISACFTVFSNYSLENAPHFSPEFWRDGGDVQALFDNWILTGGEKSRRKRITVFFEEMFEPYTNIDVFQYPFDKERGYTIINDEEQNIEVFIYQLEKLNQIKDELGRFLGIENVELINDNVGEDKWYADAYRQAKKELTFSRAYFDERLNSRLMTHFYSDADIEKFKQRWASHIKE